MFVHIDKSQFSSPINSFINKSNKQLVHHWQTAAKCDEKILMNLITNFTIQVLLQQLFVTIHQHFIHQIYLIVIRQNFTHQNFAPYNK